MLSSPGGFRVLGLGDPPAPWSSWGGHGLPSSKLSTGETLLAFHVRPPCGGGGGQTWKNSPKWAACAGDTELAPPTAGGGGVPRSPRNPPSCPRLPVPCVPRSLPQVSGRKVWPRCCPQSDCGALIAPSVSGSVSVSCERSLHPSPPASGGAGPLGGESVGPVR